jgi:hypothetical protein
MRYYPKNAVGFEINEEVAEVLGPAVSELYESWENDAFDDELFEAIEEEHGVTPMRVGALNESRGGEVQGVNGFDNDTMYLFFDVEEQDEDKWAKFVQFLEDNDIYTTEGSWSQLG